RLLHGELADGRVPADRYLRSCRREDLAMTELFPELEQHHTESVRLLSKVAPFFVGAHSFPRMMVLSSLIAHWLLNHPEEQHEGLLAALLDTVAESIARSQSYMEH